MASQNDKDTSKQFTTFLKWGKEDIIGYKNIEVCNKTQVIFIWCKLCAKRKKT